MTDQQRPVQNSEPEHAELRGLSDALDGEEPVDILTRNRDLVDARIRGLDRLDRANAYRAIAIRLGITGEIKDVIDARIQYLEEHGDRRDLPRVDRSVPEKRVVFRDEHGEEYERESVQDRIESAKKRVQAGSVTGP